ncbi:MAG: S-layer homology domain-containing protein [Cyanobacteria bacterium J06635_10]
MWYKFVYFLINILSLSDLLFSAINKVNAEQPSRDTEINQITNVNDFSDVKPTDWAYSALQNLIQLYGYPQGYQDGTFRGNKVMQL